MFFKAVGGVKFTSSSSSVRTSFLARGSSSVRVRVQFELHFLLGGGSSSVRVPVQFGVQGLLTAERERFGIQLNSKVDRIPI